MTRLLFATAFLLGGTAIVWMGLDFAGSHALAFTVTAVIGGVYLIGIIELLQFRRATSTLEDALRTLAPRTDDATQWLEHWLNRLDPSLRNAVRLRIEGERAGLPAPVFTPYLVGLLVMLGLLGTFVGMVDTLSGAVLALQGSTELQAIRAGLAAPIQGLGVAFGTSVAGVAASAMLGLISTLVRRDRMLATRQLEGKIATVFRDFSLAHHRQQAFDALQSQARALPAVADTLQAVAAQLALTGDQLGDALLARQNRFHESTGQQFTELADSIGKSLRESLAASGQAAGDSIRPVLTEAMAEITRKVSANAQTASAGMLAKIGGLLQSSETLVQTRIASESAWLDSQNERMEQLSSALAAELGALTRQQEQAHTAAVDRLAELESAVASHLTRLGSGLEEPMSRLIETASETPRAAAEVMSQLRAEITNTLERDNEHLAERQRVMEELRTLSGSLEKATTGQREAVATLVESSANMLQDISTRLGDHIAAQVATMAAAGDNVAGGATELSSLGEAFSVAVDLFHSSNESMIEHLTRVEESMERSSTRSDEQLAYYVAQAREIIDYSILSQKEIMESMHRLNRGEGRAEKHPPQEQLLETGAG